METPKNLPPEEQLKKEKNNAYWERNQLIIALSKLFPSYLAKHDKSDADWEDDWRTIVVIELPKELIRSDADVKESEWGVGMHMPPSYKNQLTWHIHDFDVGYFDHLSYFNDYVWDGHDTEEKYKRLRTLPKNLYVERKKTEG